MGSIMTAMVKWMKAMSVIEELPVRGRATMAGIAWERYHA